MSKCFKGYANDAAMECVALKAALVMPPLLLQRPLDQSQKRTKNVWRDVSVYGRMGMFSIWSMRENQFSNISPHEGPQLERRNRELMCLLRR